MNFDDAIKPLAGSLVEKPEPLAGRQTIQVILIREVQDYAIFRTEETREINTVVTASGPGGASVERVAFLATKQKGAESRELEELLRTWQPKAEPGAEAKTEPCYLKSRLCMSCPRCVLFGATDTGKNSAKGANVKHRIAYATAFSLASADEIRVSHTFNGIDSSTQKTGQTLGERESVRPGALFASIVTFRAVTKYELALALKTILACTRYGAETRIGGLVRNHIRGVVGGFEEILSPLELTIELNGKSPDLTTVKAILDTYKEKAGMSTKVKVLSVEETRALVSAVQELEVTAKEGSNGSLLATAYEHAEKFRETQDGYLKKSKD